MDNQPSKQRLSKIMAQAGIASRRASEEIIFDGRVTVNGEVVLLPQTMVDSSDKIIVDGTPLPSTEKKVYYLLNKPKGYVCSNSTGRHKKVVVDLFKDTPYRLFTVGRLDKDTTGLLIVTNDGHYSQKVIHPSSNIEKEYVADVNKKLTPQHIRAIERGAEVEGTYVQPKIVEKLDSTKVRIVVKEGKKREVRILVQNAGLSVTHLSRTRIGKLTLPGIEEGEWREMTEKEKKLIFAKGKIK